MIKHIQWSAVFIVICFATNGAVNGQEVRDVMSAQSEALKQSAATQKKVDDLDDETREMVDEYRNSMTQVDDLQRYNNQLNQLIATQQGELADYERQFQELEVTKRQILPLIVRMIEVLEEFISHDIPFLEVERSMRIVELKKLMERPDVPNSEKYRRAAEAYQIELDYGHTVEAYEGEIEMNGETRTVAFLRFGRLGLYYLTLDGNEIGMWDNEQDQWRALDNQYLQSLDRAIRIARKQLPPDLIRLPVSAPEARL